MVRLEARTDRRGGVTLVEATLVNDGPTARRVRVESELDGPVWPPRRQGVPAAGWDGDGLVVTLAPGERRGVGFASPADPEDPPATVAATRPPSDGDGGPDPRAVVRTLGDPRPPRDAVATPDDGGATTADDGRADTPDDGRAGRYGSGTAAPPGSDGTEPPASDGAEPAGGPEPDRSEGPGSERADRPEPDPGERRGRAPPPAVSAWLAAVERRVERAERARRGDAGERSTPAGGGRVASPDRLRAVAGWAGDLAARADAVGVARDDGPGGRTADPGSAGTGGSR